MKERRGSGYSPALPEGAPEKQWIADDVAVPHPAKAIRQGSEQVLRPEEERRIHTLRPSNLLAGLLLAAVILLGWLLAV